MTLKQKQNSGIVAAGHPVTANAAVEILKSGGNAFDAALAALFASCVAEPVLASLGGGGFLLAAEKDSAPLLYDFFVQTPLQKRPQSDIDFYPIVADFGTATQEFHIGTGAIATPGTIAGIATVHKAHGSMPLREIVAPACEAARQGVSVNAFQHYITEVVSPILLSTPAAIALHESPSTKGALAGVGEIVKQPDMADAFELIAIEGADLFYRGEMGQLLTEHCRQQGGYLTRDDLSAYKVEKRRPLQFNYHQARLFTNPPPSVGGTLIAFTLALLESEQLGQYPLNGHQHLGRVARAMSLTQQLRQLEKVDINLTASTANRILQQEYLKSYRETMSQHHGFSRGTTQISVADQQGNLVSMTLSNGEGAGYVIPGTGIMLNNMLGEEDINPHGFHLWPCNSRIASMMSPTLAFTPEGDIYAIGSGGSNRIRSAILQVLINLLDFQQPIELAVEQSRMHFEGDLLNIESGPGNEVVAQLEREFPKHRLWPEKNLFFGGAHSVLKQASGHLAGQGDSRRGGVCYLA